MNNDLGNTCFSIVHPPPPLLCTFYRQRLDSKKKDQIV